MKTLRLAFGIRLMSLFGLVAILFALFYVSPPAQGEFPRFENSVAASQTSEFSYTHQAKPVVLLVGGSYSGVWDGEPSQVLAVYDGSSVWTQGAKEFGRSAGSNDISTTTTSSRTFVLTATNPTFTSTELEVTSLPIPPDISLKTVVPERANDSIKAVLPISVGMAMAGSAVYRLEHFVGRLGIGSLSLLGLVSLLAIFLVRTLHLPGSYGPAVPMTCTSACGGTPGTCIDFTVRRSGVWNNLQETLSTGGLIVLSGSYFS